MTEIRLAIRRLMSRRAASAISVATLSVAVGAGAATWSMLSAVLGRHIVMVFGGKLDIEIVGVVEDVFTDIREAEPGSRRW